MSDILRSLRGSRQRFFDGERGCACIRDGKARKYIGDDEQIAGV